MNRIYTLYVVMGAFDRYGVMRYVVQHLSGLDKSRFRITLIARQATYYEMPLVPGGIEVIDLHALKWYRTLPRMVSLLRRRRPDLIWSVMTFNNCVVMVARALAGTRSKIVLSEHSALTPLMRQVGGLKARILKIAMRRLYPRADAIVAVSQGVAADLVAGYGLSPTRISVFHDSFDLDGIRSGARQETPGLQWQCPPTFVAVGRLAVEKDYPTLIAAVAMMRRPVRLLIIGDGPLADELPSLCRRLGIQDRIQFLGYQENPYKYMARAVALVLSSRFEGFSRVIVEGMACGRPVIATRCPCGPEELITDGVNGFLVPVGDSHALAEAMELLAGDAGMADRMGSAASMRADAFPAERSVARYEELFLSLLAR